MHVQSLSRGARLALGAITALSVLSLAACSSSDDETTAPTTPDSTADAGETTSPGLAEMTDITVGVIPILDVAPIYLGVQEGIFEEHNLNVTLELAQGGAAIVPGVTAGQFQFGFSNVTSLILATANDIPVQAVASGVATTGVVGADFGGVVVNSSSGITSAADLAGKKVAVNTLNNINTSTINQAVREAGGDPSTIEYVELAFPDIVPAVISGDVDAGQVVEPFLTVGTSQGLLNVVSNYVETDPELMIAEYFTSADYATSNADVVAAFTAAMNESLDYANSHPDEVRAVLATYTSMDEATQAAVTLPKWPSTIHAATVDLLAQLAVTDGFLPSVPDLSKLK